MILTVGIGNNAFHTVCVIIATLFSKCIECKYCTFLFIIILVHVRYVFIKKKSDYCTWPVKQFVVPHCSELRGTHRVSFLRST